jgi:hypothetical protein
MLNAENVKTEDDISGNSKPLPGRYHMVVNSAAEKGSKKKGIPGLEIEFGVLAGTVPGQDGKTMQLFLSYIGEDDAKTKKCLDRVVRLALCLGVLQPGQAKEVDWNEALGRELIVEVEEQEYTDKNGNQQKGSQVAYLGFWSLNNPAVADMPKMMNSPGMQAINGGPATTTTQTVTVPNAAVNQPKPSNPPTGQATNRPATGNGTAAAGKGKWSDL